MPVLVLPFSKEAEESVVGSILISGYDAIGEVMDMISPEDFHEEAPKAVYQAEITLYNRNEAINQITVAECLIGGSVSIGYLMHCVSVVSSPLEVADYANIIKEASVKRRIMEASEQMIARTQKPGISATQLVDEFKAKADEVGKTHQLASRVLNIGECKIILSRPPKYIWNVSGTDIRFALGEIVRSETCRTRIIAEKNFVPIMPKDWSGFVNNIITHSILEEAPEDASDEQQLKDYIKSFLEQKREAHQAPDLKSGKYFPKELDGKMYYCFQNSRILAQIKKDVKIMKSAELWLFVKTWGGIQREIKVPSPTSPAGEIPVHLWCLPMDFNDYVENKREQALVTQLQLTQAATPTTIPTDEIVLEDF